MNIIQIHLDISKTGIYLTIESFGRSMWKNYQDSNEKGKWNFPNGILLAYTTWIHQRSRHLQNRKQLKHTWKQAKSVKDISESFNWSMFPHCQNLSHIKFHLDRSKSILGSQTILHHQQSSRPYINFRWPDKCRKYHLGLVSCALLGAFPSIW